MRVDKKERTSSTAVMLTQCEDMFSCYGSTGMLFNSRSSSLHECCHLVTYGRLSNQEPVNCRVNVWLQTVYVAKTFVLYDSSGEQQDRHLYLSQLLLTGMLTSCIQKGFRRSRQQRPHAEKQHTLSLLFLPDINQNGCLGRRG